MTSAIRQPGRQSLQLLIVALLAIIVVLLFTLIQRAPSRGAPATQAGAAVPQVVPSPAPLGSAGAGTMARGTVSDQAIADGLSPTLRRVLLRSIDGGAAAFTTYSTHLLNSAQGAKDTTLDVVASSELSAVDREMIQGISREQAVSFRPDQGGYRILGWSGSKASPTAVMVEILAPFSFGQKSRWLVVGGVVSWSPKGWRVSSIRPREIPQPSEGVRATRDVAAQAVGRQAPVERSGWHTYRPAS